MGRHSDKPSPTPPRDHIHYIARPALAAAMGEPEILPRIVTRGETALSWEGPVPWGDVVEGVDRALQAFGKVLVWDLGGIEQNRPDLRLVRHFEGDSVWVDAGVRGAEGVIDVLIAGAERVVLGTKTMRGTEVIDEAKELTENLIPLLDFAYGELRAGPGVRSIPPAELLRRWRGLGLETALLVDEEFKVPRTLLEEAPDGMALFAGIVPRKDAGSLPPRAGAVVDIWEVVPRRT